MTNVTKISNKDKRKELEDIVEQEIQKERLERHKEKAIAKRREKDAAKKVYERLVVELNELMDDIVSGEFDAEEE